jgi:hypothetical protein
MSKGTTMSGLRLGMLMVTMIALGIGLAGCVSDLDATGDGLTPHQMRYYGGPKAPMWSGQ